jgi:ATP-binding cassette subfamily B protein
VKGSALESFKEREFFRHGLEYQDAGLRSARTQAFFTAGLEAILSASTSLLFLVGGAFVIREKISIGVFVAFQRYIQKMTWPMEGIGLAANIFQRSLASQQRVDEVINTPAGLGEPASPARLPAAIPGLRVSHLTFTYPGASQPTLQDVSFECAPGQHIGIAGGVGSGKSTLLACLARLQPVEEGKVFFGGADITQISFSDVRKRVAFVPQENFLFSRTVEENLLYGSAAFSAPPDLRREAAARAAELAAFAGDVQKLPSGYQTLLGERGTNLSGGQRQRLTIARAIARGPQIMLLDDCMSAIDAETERRLLEGILRASAGISLVISSHRASTLERLDWVILLEGGRVSAQGRPAELLRSNLAFAELARRERLENMDLLK